MENEALCRAVEKAAGRKMLTPRDFSWLEEQVKSRTGVAVSASTLKRVWGYVKTVEPRPVTLDALARYVGFSDYAAFCERGVKAQSSLVVSKKVDSASMVEGEQLRIRWQPDRVCTVECLGGGRFRVVEAVNTKLSVGDTFRCHLFIEHEPLFIDQLFHDGSGPLAYVAGRENGIIIDGD